MRLLSISIISGMLVSFALGQGTPEPSLNETLQFLDGIAYPAHFEGKEGCVVTVKQNSSVPQVNWTLVEFSLSDLDPDGVSTKRTVDGWYRAVYFHTTNFHKKMQFSSGSEDGAVTLTNEYTLFLESVDHANRFARALRHAVGLCQGQPSIY